MKKIFGGLIFFLIVLLFFWYDTFYMIEGNLTDRLTSETRDVDSRIKILAIDDESLSKIGQWPWHRDILAGTIDKLMANGALAVWPDVLYTEKSQNPEEDRAWAQLVAKYHSVFLPVYFDKVKRTNGNKQSFENINRPVFPIDPKQTGHINIIRDRDGVVRQIMLGIKDDHQQMVPMIDVRLANVLLPADQKISWTDNGQWQKGKQPIQTGLNNSVYFSYATSPRERKFEIIPIDKVISGEVAPDHFANSVVLIGFFTVGLGDSFFTPTSGSNQMYGVENHANVIQSLLDNSIYRKASRPVGALVIALLMLLTYLIIERVKAKWGVLVFIGFVILYTGLVYEIFKELHILLPYFYPLLALIIVYVASVIAQYLRERRERSRVTGIFGRYVSKAVVQEILASKEEIRVGGVRKDVTLMFVDIRGFTPLSEQMEPEDVINILNEYLDLGTRAVFTYEGTLDKFIGDGIMSIFGAPIAQEDHAERAVKAALQMRQGSEELAKRLTERYGRGVSFGIGINSGPAVIGNIGSHDRLDYTAIGDTVNLAARLESNAKPGQILISKNTYERIKEKITVTSLESIKVKGKENLVEIYQIDEWLEE